MKLDQIEGARTLVAVWIVLHLARYSPTPRARASTQYSAADWFDLGTRRFVAPAVPALAQLLWVGTLTVLNLVMHPSGGSGFHTVGLDTRCTKDGKGFAWDGQPPLSRHQLLVVFVRCQEHPQCMLQQLQAQRVPFLVYVAFLRTSNPAGPFSSPSPKATRAPGRYQKEAGRCSNATGAPSGWSRRPGVNIRTLAHNLGRECSGYLRFIVEPAWLVHTLAAGSTRHALAAYRAITWATPSPVETLPPPLSPSRHYDDLPRVTAFLQMGALMHMSFSSSLWANLQFLRGNATHQPPPYAGLSKNSIEGEWPGPCETRQKVAAFKGCAGEYWREFARTSDAPPGFFRFYANGLFAATRRRIRAHPRALYAALLDRLEGRAPLRCVHPAASLGSRAQSAVPGWSREGLHGRYVAWTNSSRLVPAESDCLMLEKLWHVLLGEPAVMPPPAAYNAQTRNYGGRARVGHIKCKPLD